MGMIESRFKVWTSFVNKARGYTKDLPERFGDEDNFGYGANLAKRIIEDPDGSLTG